ncbi:MAG: FxsA family protein [Microthrixaceae bacterium]
MFLVVLALLLALPFVELWVAIAVADAIGWPFTLLLLMAMSFSGLVLLRRQGTSVWRRANAEMAAGRVPTAQLLDGAMVIVGGMSLMVPGFITGVFGALLMLSPVRALLRPVMVAWMGARAARLVRAGRMQAVVVDTVVGPDGRVRQRTRTMGDVVDSDGWEVGSEPSGLPVAGPHGDVIEGGVIDGDVIDAGGADDPDRSGDRPSVGDRDPRNSNRDGR